MSFIYILNANKMNYSTCRELEQKKKIIKWILIGKAEDVHSKWFLGSVISESR